jgi:hypothetical protein
MGGKKATVVIDDEGGPGRAYDRWGSYARMGDDRNAAIAGYIAVSPPSPSLSQDPGQSSAHHDVAGFEPLSPSSGRRLLVGGRRLERLTSSASRTSP